ncbi:phosphomannomutase/phosphoglucomutase [Exilibacterium tricleocarpae]|uniref:phosphomannomutase n=2 Tax=Exilibacterium tricleocarpae TaxID=2591008 RepID=A0A545TZU3_9GAMM|nr:phosphomannomutase/phosphoglucomutase [Exilibacterium tricleocarpae]
MLMLNIGLAYWAYTKWVVEAQQQRLDRLTDSIGQQLASRTGERLTQLQADIERLAAQPGLAQALADNNATALRVFRNGIGRTLVDAIAIRFIPLNTADVDASGAVPLRFAELDMINRAEKRTPVTPEASSLDGAWILHAVAPIPAEAEKPVAGTLFISLGNDSLQPLLSETDSHLGKAELMQQFPLSAPKTVVAIGAGDLGAGQVHSVADTHWKIRFTPGPALAEQAAVNPLPLILVLALIAAITLAGSYQLAKHPRLLPPSAARRQAGATPDPAAAASTGETLADTIDQDILDIDVADEDRDLLGLQESSATAGGTQPDSVASGAQTKDIPAAIFRAYDIRGVVGTELTAELAEFIGRATASEALDRGETALLVGRDGRSHSPELTASLIKGILSTGCNVINIGLVPTPVLYYATCETGTTNSGVMVTASHNAAEYNGFKLVLGGGALADDDIQQLRSRILRRDFHSGQGSEEQRDITAEYIDRIFSDVALAGEISIVIDAGNGATSEVAPALFEELGCDVIPLHCKIDGSFPNHDPDPTRPENLADLIDKVRQSNADIGVAFDGDGDRIMAVTPKGEIIWPDRLLMLFAKDIVSRCPGADVIFDVKCTRQLNGLITSYGGRPVIWKSGHSHMKAKMLESDAMLGGEFSGHIFIKDRWYGFDDGMYAAARLIEIMSLRDQDLDTIFAGFPALPATPEIRIPTDEEKKFPLIRALVSQGDFQNGKITTVDGLRVDYEKSWGLVRASNTAAAITLRFEGETEEDIRQVQKVFKRELLKLDADLALNF